ncbi:hypothetical protein PMM47T1_02454 [Pseudomonas sp. M47T1]|uniref:hypothetical protein n=1 Tax=unclassified Pseudomonas TaxID=196821 RepID=UPI0002607A88|nr:hypothetical protein [Pseudomonas sp. M47T1]EIK98090.1 hypothetical protein PMM47T1_02454 [Pseudomonas sp. M47T1]
MKRGVTVVILLAIALAIWHERVALFAFPGILSAYSAKEYCSCRYVMGQSVGYCQGYVKQWLPLSSLDDDPGHARVSARGLGQNATAVWLGPRQGCRLSPGTPHRDMQPL